MLSFVVFTNNAIATNLYNFSIEGQGYQETDSFVNFNIPNSSTYFDGDLNYASGQAKTIFSTEYLVAGVVQISIPDTGSGEKISLYNISNGQGELVKEINYYNSCSQRILCGYVYVTPGEYAFVYDSTSLYLKSTRPPTDFKFFPYFDNDSSKDCQSLISIESDCGIEWLKVAFASGEKKTFERFKNETILSIKNPEDLAKVQGYYGVLNAGISAFLLVRDVTKLSENLDQLDGTLLEQAQQFISQNHEDVASIALGELNGMYSSIAYQTDNMGIIAVDRIKNSLIAATTLLLDPSNPASWVGAGQDLSGNLLEIANLWVQRTSVIETKKQWNSYWVAYNAVMMYLVQCNGSESCYKLNTTDDFDSSFQFIFDKYTYLPSGYTNPFDAAESRVVYSEIMIRLGHFRDNNNKSYLLHMDVDGDGYLNEEDEDPNNPLIPYVSDKSPIPIIATYGAPKLNETVSLTSSSYHPGNLEFTITWNLANKPSGSSVVIPTSQLHDDLISFVPDLPGNYTFELTAKDENNPARSTSTVIKVPEGAVDVEYPPSARRWRGDYSGEYVVGVEYDFAKVRGFDVDGNLSHVIWRSEPSHLLKFNESDNRDDFSSSVTQEGFESIGFTLLDENNGSPIYLYADVYDDEGNVSNEPAKWVLNPRLVYSPQLTPVFPNTPTVELALGAHDFLIDVFDQDDNANDIFWYLDGVFVDTSGTGGGDPKTQEKGDIYFDGRGVYEVKAVVDDDDGNTSEFIWTVNAGTITDGNLPPVLTGEPYLDSDQPQYSIFRVNHNYQFKCTAEDADINLHKVSISLNGELLHESVDNQFDDDKRTAYYDIAFPTAGDYTISCFAIDAEEKTASSSRIITVLDADEFSGTAPILEIYPADSTWTSVGDRFYYAGRALDGDFDLQKLLFYLNGSLIHEEEIYSHRGASFYEYIEDTQGISSSGTHTLKIVAVDVNGNKSNEISKTIKPGYAGISSPSVFKALPAGSDPIKITQAAANDGILLYVYASDSDGDLDTIEWDMAGVGNVDGDLVTPEYTESNNISGYSFGDNSQRVRPQYSGRIYAKAKDDGGRLSSSVYWDIEIVADKINVSPQITNRNYVDGSVSVKSSEPNEDVTVEFDVFDKDGDLKSVVVSINGTPVEPNAPNYTEESFTFDDGCSLFTKGRDCDRLNFSFDYRGEQAVFDIVVEDYSGNTVTETFTVIQGPFDHTNHAPVVDASIDLILEQRTSKEFTLSIIDEEGDIPVPKIKNITFDGDVNYLGNYTFDVVPESYEYGPNSFEIEWNDGFGGISTSHVTINIQQVILPPVINITSKIFLVKDDLEQIYLDQELAPFITTDYFDINQLSWRVKNNVDIEITDNSSFSAVSISLNDGVNSGLLIGYLEYPNGAKSNEISIELIATNYDKDELADYLDPDDDNDNVLDADDAFPLDPTESVDTDNDGIGNIADTDDDNDGMPDEYELANGLNPLDASDAALDTDNDQLTNLQEFTLGTNPNNNDTDGDGIIDGLDSSPLDILISSIQVNDMELARCITEKTTGLTTVSEVTTLDCSNFAIESLEGISQLTELETLSLHGTKISSFNGVEGLGNLNNLRAGNVSTLTDISAIADMSQLTNLDVYNTSVADLDVLANLINLTELGTTGTLITDYSVLAQFQQLTWLGLNNSVNDLSPYAGLVKLDFLVITSTLIDYDQLAAFPQLANLVLIDNSFSDLTKLSSIATQLSYLTVDSSSLINLQNINAFTNLSTLFLSDSPQLENISGIGQLSLLKTLSLSGTKVSNISSLASLYELTYLYIDRTQVSDLSPLFALDSLSRVSLRDIPLNDASQLQILRDKGVQVVGEPKLINDIALLELNNLVEAMVSPSSDSVLYNGQNTNFVWDGNALSGDNVDIYVLHDDPTNIGGGTNVDLALVQARNWYKFSYDVTNDGSVIVDPAVMNGTGNAYKLLLITDTGKWAVSEGLFSLMDQVVITDYDSDGIPDSEDAYPELPSFKLTINSDSSQGLITSDVGTLNCGEQCVLQLLADTNFTLNFIPNSGFVFKSITSEYIGCSRGSSASYCNDVAGVGDYQVDFDFAVDTDNDGVADEFDNDDDNDGVFDNDDLYPLTSSLYLTLKTAGIGSGTIAVTNTDISCTDECVVQFITDSEFVITVTPEQGFTSLGWDGSDNLGCHNGSGPLFCNDIAAAGYAVAQINFDVDTDLDGEGNSIDSDDDGDNYLDTDEVAAGSDPLNGESLPLDTDGDYISDVTDTDDDNDGVVDVQDAFPLDATESVDTDLDGIGNNEDTDDDGDRYADADEVSAGSDPLNSESRPLDTDGDFISDVTDTDDDNDGVEDSQDAFPLDASESVDTDLDGIGNNADLDDDGDKYVDADEIAAGSDPLNGASLPLDTDGDFISDVTDTDDDGDGVEDSQDAFPLDATESVDTDGDGIGNNTDTDDDGDGIVDSEDEAPLDNTIGDSQAPVFGETLELTFEATGVTTAIELVEPEVTDNNLNTPTLVSNYSEALPLGSHEITWTATDFAGNTATATQQVLIVDTTTPEFAEAQIQTINARGLVTNITNDIAFEAHDIVDGDIAVQIVGNAVLSSGKHVVVVSAEDASGNMVEADVNIHINPRVELTQNTKVEPGATIAIPVYLSGDAAIYPVVIDYAITDVDLQTNNHQLIIEAEDKGSLPIVIPSAAVNGEVVKIALTSAVNAVLGNVRDIELLVVAENNSPTLQVTLEQNNNPITVVDAQGGVVTVTATINDMNALDTHDITWSANNSALVDIGTDSLSTTFEFSPESLESNTYGLSVQVKENNTSELHEISVATDIVVDAALATLSDEDDSDNDGTPDAEEGYADSDQDGIADYLDDDDIPSHLPIGNDSAPMQTINGLTLSLGDVASSANGVSAQDAAVDINDITENGGENGAEVTNSLDAHFETVSTIINFNLSGLTEVGITVPVVIPLADGDVISAGSTYRKYNAARGWFNFVEDDYNAILSAQTDSDGNCPAPLSNEYKQGLNVGDNCIELLIKDGGDNDADGLANGMIKDPGVLTTETPNQAPVINLVNAIEVNEITDVVLDASATTDAESDTLTYQWTQWSGSEVSLSDTDTALLSFVTPPVTNDELLTFELVVSDGRDSVIATVEVLVLQVNALPTVLIDTHASSFNEGASVSLSAQGTDEDNDTLTYLWEQVSGPNITLSDNTLANISFTAPEVAGNQTVEIKVTVLDGTDSVSATTSFVVNNVVAPVTPPKESSDGGGGSMAWLLILLGLASLRGKEYRR